MLIFNYTDTNRLPPAHRGPHKWGSDPAGPSGESALHVQSAWGRHNGEAAARIQHIVIILPRNFHQLPSPLSTDHPSHTPSPPDFTIASGPELKPLSGPGEPQCQQGKPTEGLEYFFLSFPVPPHSTLALPKVFESISKEDSQGREKNKSGMDSPIQVSRT